jgi:adenylate cyclase
VTILPIRYRRLLIPLLGPKATGTLPEQTKAAIEEQENRGEILVKLIQLLIVSIWGVLYAVSPKAETSGMALAPYAIGLYLAMNSIGLAWALKRRLPDWAVYVSIFFDMLLLFAVIWSFHVQYMQPPAFYLKAPTIMYVFVFIALRALRFQPRFVLAAGGAAAVGWLAMIIYVVASDPAHATITRNYVAYMTGNLILIGAEIDKIIAILMVTGILALSLSRGRDLLVRATAETAAARSLSRFFDTSIAEDIRSGEYAIAAGEGLVRNAAVLNVDIRGFSRLVEDMEPSGAIRILATYQRRVVPIIQRHGGVIDKFMGDGIMATFGAVRPSASYAADALRAMDAVIEDINTWDDDPELGLLTAGGVGIAVSAGPIVFGAVGDQDRLEVTVIGATVNLSAKLEKANKTLASEAITTRAAFDLALEQGHAPKRAPRFLDTRVDGVGSETAIAVWHRKDRPLP